MNKFPAALRGKLEFGNPEQIKALKQWRGQIAVEEEREQAKAENGLTEYMIEYTRIFSATVVARTADEAEELLEKRLTGDFDIDAPHVVGPGEGEPRVVNMG